MIENQNEVFRRENTLANNLEIQKIYFLKMSLINFCHNMLFYSRARTNATHFQVNQPFFTFQNLNLHLSNLR